GRPSRNPGCGVGAGRSRFEICRWVASSDKIEMGKFLDAYPSSIRVRSRRRAGVHGVERLQPALRAAALAKDRLHGCEGLPEGGGLNLSWRSSAALPRALCAATRRVPKAKVITTFCIETICLIPQR